MYKVSLNKLIGISIRAARKLNAYSLPSVNSTLLFSIPTAGSAGKVWSWVERPDGIWLMFQRSGGSFYYIRADKGSFSATDQIIQAYQEQKQELEKKKLQDKGAFRYYLDKYGILILGAFIVTAVAREYIKRK